MIRASARAVRRQRPARSVRTQQTRLLGPRHRDPHRLCRSRLAQTRARAIQAHSLARLGPWPPGALNPPSGSTGRKITIGPPPAVISPAQRVSRPPRRLRRPRLAPDDLPGGWRLGRPRQRAQSAARLTCPTAPRTLRLTPQDRTVGALERIAKECHVPVDQLARANHHRPCPL